MMKRQTRGGWLFVLVAVISAVVALAPVLRGRSVNATLLGVAAFWFIIAIIVMNRARASSGADRH